MLYQTSGWESRRGNRPVEPRSRLRASGEIPPSERSVESPGVAVRRALGKQSCGPNVSESLQPREIGTERQGGRADHVPAKATDCGAVASGDPQDTLGVGEGARSEGLVRNRRDPIRRPTSGEGGGYKPKASAAHNTVNQAGASPAAAIARFGCVAMSDVVDGRPPMAEAQAKVPAAAAMRSDLSGGRAKTGAAAIANTAASRAYPTRNRSWGLEQPSLVALGEGQWTPVKKRVSAAGACSGVWVVAPVEWEARQSGDALSDRKAFCINGVTAKSEGDAESGGSGRSSEDARGQHNPSGAKDPWDRVALKGWRGRTGNALGLTGVPRASSQQERRVDQTSILGRVDPTGGHTVLKPYWGKPTVRNFRGARGNGVRETLFGHEAGNGGYRQAATYWPPRLASTRQCHRAGRESERLVVPWMAPTITSPEGRGLALVVLAVRGKGEGMPLGANNLFVKARELGNELSVTAESAVTNGAAIDSQELPRLTSSGWMAAALDHVLDACDTGRPSVSRVLEIGTHGLKGGFRSPGPHGHRA